jgi:hypothetical protein
MDEPADRAAAKLHAFSSKPNELDAVGSGVPDAGVRAAAPKRRR